VSLVGQPLLAVRFCPAETVRDSQEWLSYKNRKLTNHREAGRQERRIISVVDCEA